MNNVEKNLRKSIGRKIKIARIKAEYTQEELAEKLSLSARYISQLERGIAFGSATTITSICKALNINSNFLFDEVIQNDSPIRSDFIDQYFLENYLKLNSYNKLIVNSITAELVKFQKSYNVKKEDIQ